MKGGTRKILSKQNTSKSEAPHPEMGELRREVLTSQHPQWLDGVEVHAPRLENLHTGVTSFQILQGTFQNIQLRRMLVELSLFWNSRSRSVCFESNRWCESNTVMCLKLKLSLCGYSAIASCALSSFHTPRAHHEAPHRGNSRRAVQEPPKAHSSQGTHGSTFPDREVSSTTPE